MPELSVLNTSDELPPEIGRQIRALLATEWPGSDEEMVSGPLLAPDLHPVYFVITSEDRVVSYGRTIWAWVPHKGGALKLYGLGDVVSAPEWRRSGYGDRIVEAASVHIRSDPEADVAVLLTTPALEAWYGRHGWTLVPGLNVKSDEYEDAKTAGVLPMVLVLSPVLGASPADLAGQMLTLPGDEW
jgi:predicted N-acetyltransferase YhbS